MNLRTRDIPLRRAAGVMNGQRLDAQEVLAVGDALGDVVRVVGWLVTRVSDFTVEGVD